MTDMGEVPHTTGYVGGPFRCRNGHPLATGTSWCFECEKGNAWNLPPLPEDPRRSGRVGPVREGPFEPVDVDRLARDIGVSVDRVRHAVAVTGTLYRRRSVAPAPDRCEHCDKRLVYPVGVLVKPVAAPSWFWALSVVAWLVAFAWVMTR